MPRPVKIGILGYGNAARVYHLPFITTNPNYVIHAFLQRTPAPSDPSKTEQRHCTIDYPDAKHYTDLDEFLADPEIELVSVLTRHDTHSSFAAKALLAGKHGTLDATNRSRKS
jgi:predicted dehydrogenase